MRLSVSSRAFLVRYPTLLQVEYCNLYAPLSPQASNGILLRGNTAPSSLFLVAAACRPCRNRRPTQMLAPSQALNRSQHTDTHKSCRNLVYIYIYIYIYGRHLICWWRRFRAPEKKPAHIISYRIILCTFLLTTLTLARDAACWPEYETQANTYVCTRLRPDVGTIAPINVTLHAVDALHGHTLSAGPPDAGQMPVQTVPACAA